MTAVHNTTINPSRGDPSHTKSDNAMMFSQASFNPYGNASTVVTEATSSLSELNLTDHSSSSTSSSSSSSSSSAVSYNSSSFHEEQKGHLPSKQNQTVTSVETPWSMNPYAVTDTQDRANQFPRFDQYVEREKRQEQLELQPRATSPKRRYTTQAPGQASLQGRSKAMHKKNPHHHHRQHHQVQRNRNRPLSQKRVPKVTSACPEAFRKMIPPTSFLAEELGTDPVYLHALKAGTVWQSLVGQHVRLPVLWYDGAEPARPYLGCYDADKRNKWSYVGRHRVVNDPKLNQRLVKHPTSSGKLLLHIVCRDTETWEATEDVVVGVFHPNADSIRASDRDFQGAKTTQHSRHQRKIDEQRNEHCRDIWIAHRSRRVAAHGTRTATRIESLLRYINKNRVDQTPLGGDGGPGQTKRTIDNSNVNSIFGRGPPRNTVFVSEDELYNLLSPLAEMAVEGRAKSVPASVLLMRHFLR